VSGELHISASPVVLRLVRALEALAQQVPPEDFAVIGGLAVMVRLEGAHRVTDDLDTVAIQHGDDPTTVEVITGVKGTIAGTRVDCIGVGDIPAAELPLAKLPTTRLTGLSSSRTDGRSTRQRVKYSTLTISMGRRR
jgi:hypothetical protein